jgi:MiaB-like tRNA modifying enzyme
MRIYVEGYGCSMNLSETEQIRGHAFSHGFSLESSPENADFIVINTCGVKGRTELDMLARIRRLNEIAVANGSQLVVFGCLPKINLGAIERISNNIIAIGPDLEKLSEVLGIAAEPFSPSVEFVSSNPYVSIIPIQSGCTNFCTFCGTKLARGNIKSYSPDKIKARVEKSLSVSKEFWFTGQDTGAYGLDIGCSLPDLLSKILEIPGDFRIRIGMMNPHHLLRIYNKLVPLFSDNRLYKFLHIPLQSGSDRVLRVMRRGYTASQYVGLVSSLKRDVPGITIATDVIVGFPTESDSEFEETVSVIRETMPDIVNVSKFAPRPGTLAADMPQLPGKVVKERSSRMSSLCRLISYHRSRAEIGYKGVAYFSEVGSKGKFLGRLQNYKPVLIDFDLRGRFAEVEVVDAGVGWLAGVVLNNYNSDSVRRGKINLLAWE